MLIEAINPTSLVTFVEEGPPPPKGTDVPSPGKNLGRPGSETPRASSLHVARQQDAKVRQEINRNETAPVSSNFRITFDTSEESRRTAISVIDKETGEIIREIPPEKLLEMTENIQRSMGMIFDSKV